ncbi:TetR/AcrR family transcriptional regulator [Amycolatopsis sp. K13G38]|uniref:TetR/AcrR family transcriptional regulator n=1 Tax=Amycolatopsis acididurans TaxID=2724524 RepID=A0ABX1J166_9PSEU|nr:TetR/AcrR family transcriptional regulator [Amycolatopsis acididurans]NKQ52719.1 TetR/AcrR family transcriptional regulator [Amycolatopsis acididurans]
MRQAEGTRPRNRAEQIVLAAAELFCARGYHNVGIDDIADAVGITGPAIYRHFRTKRDLLADAVQRMCAEMVDTVDRGVNVPGEPFERLAATFAALLELTLKRRAVARLYQWEGRHLTDDERAGAGERLSAALRRLRDLLREARPELSKDEAHLLVRAGLSVMASPSTHHARLAPTRTRATLLGACRAILQARDLPAAGTRIGTEPASDVLPRRERLISEAVRLFHRDGYHDVSMGDIGAAAGINASSVYKHFPSKADLLAAACHRAAARLEVATADALAGAGTAAEALEALIAAYVGLSFAQADLVSVYLSQDVNLPQADRHALHVAQRRHVDIWVELTSETAPGPAAQHRYRVHAALNVIADLARWRPDMVGVEPTAYLAATLLVG